MTDTLTRSDALWILTGYGHSEEDAARMLGDLETLGVEWTSTTLRRWHQVLSD